MAVMSRVRDPFQQPNDHICPAKATIKVASVESGSGGQANTFQVRASFIIKPLCSPSLLSCAATQDPEYNGQ